MKERKNTNSCKAAISSPTKILTSKIKKAVRLNYMAMILGTYKLIFLWQIQYEAAFLLKI